MQKAAAKLAAALVILAYGRQIPKLPFGELGCLTGLLETVFLPLLHTRITGQESGPFHDRTVFWIGLGQCPGNSVSNCAGLTTQAPSSNVNQNVKASFGLRFTQGHPYLHFKDGSTKIFGNVFAVNNDVSV